LLCVENFVVPDVNTVQKVISNETESLQISADSHDILLITGMSLGLSFRKDGG